MSRSSSRKLIKSPFPKPPVPQLCNPKVQIYLSGMRGIGEDGHWRTKNKWLYKGRIRGCTKGNPNRIRHRVGRQFKAGKSTFCWPTISERNLLDNQRLASSRGVLGQNRSKSLKIQVRQSRVEIARSSFPGVVS